MIEKEKLKRILDLLESSPNSKWIAPEYTSNLWTVINKLLQEVFNKDQYEWIEWWVWETNFGKDNLGGSYLDKDNNKIDIIDYDTLYDCLTNY